MQLFAFSITDLTTFESIPHEEWVEKEDLFEAGNRFGRAMLAANPEFSSSRHVRGDLRRSRIGRLGDAARFPAVVSPTPLRRGSL
jgi:hypothetical protein